MELKTEYFKVVVVKEQEQELERKELCIATLGNLIIDRNIAIAPNERKQIPFTFRVPDCTPISMNRRSVWLETKLDIPLALDPEDRDYLDIRPSHTMEVVLDAMTNVLGFRLREVECNEGYVVGRQGDFLQEFEFVPESALRTVLDELEISFLPNPEGIDIFAQIDRKVRNFKTLIQEVVDLDEECIIFTITHDDAAQGSNYVAQILQDTIEEYC